MSQRFSIDKQVAAVGSNGLGASYVVAADANGAQHFHAGAVYTLALRAESAFDDASVLAGQTFKLQTGRTIDGVADPADPRWTDVALYDAAAPDTPAAVEHTLVASIGKTVALDLYADLGHRGRAFFRVLVKKSGGGAAAGADAFSIYAVG
jgi:hypothetical protein